MQTEDSDVYLRTKYETYLKRSVELRALTYPEFYQWWRSATTEEQQKAATAIAKGELPQGVDDLKEYSAAMAVSNADLHVILDNCQLAVTNLL